MMRLRSGDQRPLLVATALCLLSALALLTATAPPAAGAAPQITAAPTRPPQSVAYARIALVRVLAYYTGTVNSDPAPIPVLRPCAADGVLAGTTGAGLNSFDYVLTPTAAVNPITPCAGVQSAFQQLNGLAASWSLARIDVVLDAAYTGTDKAQRGAIHYSIDPAQIATIGGAAGPQLLALPLQPAVGAPAHDLPVLSVPQASDTPADPADTNILDLTGSDGQPLNRDSLSPTEIGDTLYPISLPASQLNIAPLPTPIKTATPISPQQTVIGGTVAPATATRSVPTVSGGTPTPLSAAISLGAPAVDGNGRLVGMVIAGSGGAHVIAPLAVVTAAINQVKGKPGALMSFWQQGITAFYATPPQFAGAQSSFSTLAQANPDFAGVAPFLDAAKQRTTAIPTLTRAPGSETTGPTGPVTGVSTRALLVAGTMAIAVLFLLIIAALLLMRRRAAHHPALVPPEEANLNLLPRDLPLDALPLEPSPPPPDDITAQPTRPIPSLAPLAHAAGIDGEATLVLRASPSRDPRRQRRGLALMPHAAGLTDPGIKRARDPNQDSILALNGLRIVDGRPQPYGLFIVADGMGGHLNGQEASRIAIEMVTTAVMQTLTTAGQALDDAALMRLLREGVQHAGVELRARNLNERADMGTTITAALVVDDQAYIVNVGDSRTYLMSPEMGLRQITTDHSVVASLVAAGVIRPEDVYTHPRRNQIYRSLGGEFDDVEIDSFEVPLQAGDKLLLCSDGLWEMVRDPQIESILRGAVDPRAAAELLVREANTNGGEDNISAIVIRLLEDVPQQAQPSVRVLVAPEAVPPAPGP
ncbi:MAG TPA: protein phosphatase 2C domain-containing protein [Ktedonobacterales bacterium]|nr:protein phosphatase 2C domain-containing protein [Ktedonobacterales bacterium]